MKTKFRLEKSLGQIKEVRVLEIRDNKLTYMDDGKLKVEANDNRFFDFWQDAQNARLTHQIHKVQEARSKLLDAQDEFDRINAIRE
jgi:hypothetical protein